MIKKRTLKSDVHCGARYRKIMQLKQEMIKSQLKTAVPSKDLGEGSRYKLQGPGDSERTQVSEYIAYDFIFLSSIILLLIVFHSFVTISSIGESVTVLSMF